MVALYLAGVPVARTSNCTLKVNHDIIETTVKESGGWFEGMSGKRSASLSVEGAVFYPGTYGYSHATLVSWIIGRNTVSWVMRTSVSGDNFFSGAAFVASADTDNPAEDQSTFSAELTVIGAVSIGTV